MIGIENRNPALGSPRLAAASPVSPSELPLIRGLLKLDQYSSRVIPDIVFGSNFPFKTPRQMSKRGDDDPGTVG
jgi:hypothetical protein